VNKEVYMLSKKKRILILSIMLVLLVVTGYLNLTLNDTLLETGGQATTTNLFTAHRDYRTATREQEMLYYDAIIASTASSAEAKTDAEAKKFEIIATMEKELAVEGLIKAKGFEDCIVSTSASIVNVIVKSEALESSQVAQIVSIIQEQLQTELGNIKIQPIE